MDQVKQIATKIGAGYPLIDVVTNEEQRALADVKAAILKVKKQMVIWAQGTGATKYSLDQKTSTAIDNTATLDVLLAWFLNDDQIMNTVVVLLDLSGYSKNYLQSEPGLHRGLRDMIAQAPYKQDKDRGIAGCNIVHIGPEFPVYPSIEKMRSIVEYDLPTPADYEKIVREQAEANEVQVNGKLDEMVRACAGLTWDEANNAVCLSIVETGNLDSKVIKREKVAAIKGTGYLTLLPAERGGLDSVGGHDLLKAYLKQVFSGSQKDMEEFGAEGRKGIALVGPAGSGKSLIMKIISLISGNESILVDVPAMQNSLIGETEKNARKATALISAISPVNACIDEADKALAGSQTQNAGDSGVGRKLFGHLLTWMQDQSGAFVCLTMNSIDGIDAAMFRSGRLDGVWAVDYPAPPERIEILRIHFAKRKRNLAEILTSKEQEQQFIDLTDDYSGAEIEQIVKDSILAAFADGKRKVTAQDVIEAAKSTVPIAVTKKEEIAAIRKWCKDNNVRPSSSYRAKKETQQQTAGRKVQTY